MEGQRVRGPAERSAQVDVHEQRRPAMSRLPSRAEACRIPASREHLHVLAPGSWQWGDEAGRPRQWVGNHGPTEQGALCSVLGTRPGRAQLGQDPSRGTHIGSDASTPRRLFNLPRT